MLLTEANERFMYSVVRGPRSYVICCYRLGNVLLFLYSSDAKQTFSFLSAFSLLPQAAKIRGI